MIGNAVLVMKIATGETREINGSEGKNLHAVKPAPLEGRKAANPERRTSPKRNVQPQPRRQLKVVGLGRGSYSDGVKGVAYPRASSTPALSVPFFRKRSGLEYQAGSAQVPRPTLITPPLDFRHCYSLKPPGGLRELLAGNRVAPCESTAPGFL